MRKRAAVFIGVGALLLAALAVSLHKPEPYKPHAELGWLPRPGPGINSVGLRDTERVLHKPRGVYRIAVLGDEFSEGRGISRRETWWYLAEEALQSCGFQSGRRLEVLNFAVSGYGTAQQYVMLQTRALRYAPDLVLLQFGADDVRNNAFLLEARKDRPFFMLDADGSLRLDDSFATAPAFARQLTLRGELLQRFSLRLPLPEARAASAPAPAPLLEEAWQITEAALGASAELAERNGARLMLLHAEERLARFALDNQIETIDLGSARGHRAVAQATARALCPARGGA